MKTSSPSAPEICVHAGDRLLAIYTAPAGTTILRIFFGFYGNQTPQFGAPPPGAMGWMFLSDGTIDEVDLNSGVDDGPPRGRPDLGAA